MTTLRITRATTADVNATASLIAEAFYNLPPSIWLVPDPEERITATQVIFRMWANHALEHGHIDLIDSVAAAVWFNRESDELPLPEDYERLITSNPSDPAKRFRALDEHFAQHHPEKPHHHLAFLAVHPKQQNKGLGSALLDHHHAELDQLGLSAYLEASSELNRPLYLRKGYSELEPAWYLPAGPAMWSMWRDPQ